MDLASPRCLRGFLVIRQNFLQPPNQTLIVSERSSPQPCARICAKEHSIDPSGVPS
jgi:hypothetical protein